ncbi:MAG: hypothetical protein M3Q71_15005 [Chloroflexota bacterium]|nr:hypothetical protein [Chloroflexota bacterium]
MQTLEIGPLPDDWWNEFWPDGVTTMEVTTQDGVTLPYRVLIDPDPTQTYLKLVPIEAEA